MAVSWHPLLAAAEPAPGRWELRDQYDRVYGRVSIVRRGPEVGYRAEDAVGVLIGYFTTLRGACEAVHRRFLASHGPGEFGGYPVFAAPSDGER